MRQKVCVRAQREEREERGRMGMACVRVWEGTSPIPLHVQHGTISVTNSKGQAHKGWAHICNTCKGNVGAGYGHNEAHNVLHGHRQVNMVVGPGIQSGSSSKFKSSFLSFFFSQNFVSVIDTWERSTEEQQWHHYQPSHTCAAKVFCSKRQVAAEVRMAGLCYAAAGEGILHR